MKKYQTLHLLFLLLPLIACPCHAHPSLPNLLKSQLLLKNLLPQKPSPSSISRIHNPQDQRACIELSLGPTQRLTLKDENGELVTQYHQMSDPLIFIQEEPKEIEDIQDLYHYIDNIEQEVFKRHYLNYGQVIFLYGNLRRLQAEVEIENKHILSDSTLDIFSDMDHIEDIRLIDVLPSDDKKIFFKSHLAWGEAKMDLQAGWQWPSNGEMLNYRFEYLDLQATLQFGARSKQPQVKWERLQQDSEDSEHRLGFYRDLTQKELLMFMKVLSEHVRLVHEGLFSPNQRYLLQRLLQQINNTKKQK